MYSVAEILTPQTVGKRVRLLRRMLNMSQSELNAASGVPTQELSKIERDLRPCMRLVTAQKLAKGLGVTTAHLTGELPLFDPPPNGE